jgi:hypothetical protein
MASKVSNVGWKTKGAGGWKKIVASAEGSGGD